MAVMEVAQADDALDVEVLPAEDGVGNYIEAVLHHPDRHDRPDRRADLRLPQPRQWPCCCWYFRFRLLHAEGIV